MSKLLPSPPDDERWPKKNDLISGMKWLVVGVGAVTTFSATQEHSEGPWMIEFMEAKSMQYAQRPISDFMNVATPIVSWEVSNDDT